MKKFFEPFMGLIFATLSFEMIQDVIVAIIIAFFGAIAGWIARKLCESVYKKFFEKK